MTYKELKEKARDKFLEKYPSHEIILIWDNREIVFGKMVFMVKARSLNDEVEERVIIDV